MSTSSLPSTSRARVLIVEDERIVAVDLADSLREMGYSVSGVATSAGEAIASALAARPDLVLCDVRIDGTVDGIELAERLRLSFQLPVVFLTAFADDETLARIRGVQSYGYLLKPFNPQELKGTIEVALQRHEADQRVDAILSNIEDGVVLLSADGTPVIANASFYKMFGLDPWRVLGMSNDEFMSHLTLCMRDPDVDLAMLGRLTMSGSSTQFELSSPHRRIVRQTVKSIRVASSNGFLIVWHDDTAAHDLIREREQRANTDALTGAGNRHAAELAMAGPIGKALRAGRPLSLAIFDVDHFKSVNDTHGHAVGDEVLHTIARILIGEARGNDLVVRWGGEEFVVILHGEVAGAVAFAERVRATVEAATTAAGHVTISAGVTSLQRGEALVDAVTRGDQLLYAAKRAGRNRVCAAATPET